MEAHDRLKELGEVLVTHPEAATSSPDLLTMTLDAMVEDGLLEKLVRGPSTTYAVAVALHDHEWYKPSVVKSETPPGRGQHIQLEWNCRVSGCRKRKFEWIAT